jgi:hypothetical protein
MTATKTGTSNVTHLHFEAQYHGHTVKVSRVWHPLDGQRGEQWPLTCDHEFQPLDHYGVPTGEIICQRCWCGGEDPEFDESAS